MSKKVFLSHPHSAGPMAVRFAHWLTDVFVKKLTVICTSEPTDHIDPGRMVTTGIVEYIKESEMVLVLITRASLGLPWIFYEMGAAQALGKVFIPCVAQGLSLRELPPQAYEYQGADLNSPHDLRKLIDAIRVHSHLEPTPADFVAAAAKWA